MPLISKEEYTNLKEYYDYQRKIQYNRERCEKMAEEFEGRIAIPEIGMLSETEIFNIMWNKIKPSDYDDPPKDWVPYYDNLRFEWEIDPKLPTKKGKKVVVAAKEKWDDYIDELNDSINDDYNIQK